MLIGLVTNFGSRGLRTDARLLGELIIEAGHDWEPIQYDVVQDSKADLFIFLEVVVPALVDRGKFKPLFIPNPEFLFDRDLDIVRSCFGKVLCKTHESLRICSGLFGDMAFYTGFISDDKFDPSIARERKFLHVAGASQVKGTQAVIDAWRWKKDGVGIDGDLTVVADWVNTEHLPERVTVLPVVDAEALRILQNKCLFHLQPSATEGWSHVLHESMSVGAVIATTAAPPMNEDVHSFIIPPIGTSQFHQATLYEVSPLSIHSVAKAMLGWIWPSNGQSGTNRTQAMFLLGNAEFKRRFTYHLEHLEVREQPMTQVIQETRKRPLRIVFLGNFGQTFCTESELAWTFEHLGHFVFRQQENVVSAQDLANAVKGADLFLWVHTHGWDSIFKSDMHNLLHWLRRMHIPSASFHLDKFWGIPERETPIGLDPFWKTDHVFTADGGFDAAFSERGVNHHWLPPAVVERDCHYGTPRDEFLNGIAFVGAADGYHSNYPFRQEMVKGLRARYGDHFCLASGIRGNDLNDFYASTKILVGDCIFSGTPNYWSDRLPETAGRGGFILYPRVPGMTIPVPTYVPQDLEDLYRGIDYWLAHPVERNNIRIACHEHVREQDTYTNRVKSMLKVIFNDQQKIQGNKD